MWNHRPTCLAPPYLLWRRRKRLIEVDRRKCCFIFITLLVIAGVFHIFLMNFVFSTFSLWPFFLPLLPLLLLNLGPHSTPAKSQQYFPTHLQPACNISGASWVRTKLDTGPSCFSPAYTLQPISPPCSWVLWLLGRKQLPSYSAPPQHSSFAQFPSSSSLTGELYSSEPSSVSLLENPPEPRCHLSGGLVALIHIYHFTMASSSVFLLARPGSWRANLCLALPSFPRT